MLALMLLFVVVACAALCAAVIVLWGFAIISIIATFPSLPIWALSKSIARRTTGNEDNLWVVYPAFAVSMLVIVGVDVFFGRLAGLRNMPNTDMRVIIFMAIALYCAAAFLFVSIAGIAKLVIATCAIGFNALGNTLRGAEKA